MIGSEFGVSRGGGFLIKRSLFGFERIKNYPLNQIPGVVAWRHIRKGEGLQLQLASGRRKGLTMSLHFQHLGNEALALDSSIRTLQERSRADHRVREGIREVNDR